MGICLVHERSSAMVTPKYIAAETHASSAGSLETISTKNRVLRIVEAARGGVCVLLLPENNALISNIP